MNPIAPGEKRYGEVIGGRNLGQGIEGEETRGSCPVEGVEARDMKFGQAPWRLCYIIGGAEASRSTWPIRQMVAVLSRAAGGS